ncbi:MAG: phosphatase PAP2 family protein [archaeon]|nr:phosphatase PAP2 family protein [archaeon]
MVEEISLGLSKKELIISCSITIIVLIIGLVLLVLGLNEGFYVENSAIRGIFNIITQIGDEMAYLVLLALALFAIDWKFGKKLFIGFMINVFFNNLFKDIFKDPRPATNWPDGITEDPIETGFGFPSGHTQNGVGFWGYTLFNYSKNGKPNTINMIFKIVCIVLIVLLPISRVVIGVHDLNDIIGGFVIGMVILILYLLITPKLEIFKAKPLLWKIIVGLTVSLIFWLIPSIILLSPYFEPTAAENLGQAGGLLIAISIGLPIEEQYIKYDPKDFPIKKKILAGIIGLVITFIGYFGLGELFDILFTTNLWIWRCIRYLILGLLLTTLVPILLKKTLDKQ